MILDLSEQPELSLLLAYQSVKHLQPFKRRTRTSSPRATKTCSKIDPSVIIHKLNVSPFFSPIHQKKQVFTQDRDKAIAEEVCKL